MNKVKIGTVPYLYPVPIVLVGALVDGRPNFEEVGDVAVAGIKPALVMVSSGVTHHTNKGMLEHQAFSINIPDTSLLAKTDYCGIHSGADVDKSELFDVFYGENKNVPLIRECPVNLECKVLREFCVEHRQIFVAEVTQTHISEEFITEVDGRKRIADLAALDPIMYALDNKYYRMGEVIGEGYQEGKKVSVE